MPSSFGAAAPTLSSPARRDMTRRCHLSPSSLVPAGSSSRCHFDGASAGGVLSSEAS